MKSCGTICGVFYSIQVRLLETKYSLIVFFALLGVSLIFQLVRKKKYLKDREAGPVDLGELFKLYFGIAFCILVILF